jgi:hypothetical protein
VVGVIVLTDPLSPGSPVLAFFTSPAYVAFAQACLGLAVLVLAFSLGLRVLRHCAPADSWRYELDGHRPGCSCDDCETFGVPDWGGAS